MNNQLSADRHDVGPAQSMGDGSPVGPVDPEMLPRLVGDDPGVLSEFFCAFAQSAGEAGMTLRTAAQDGDSKEIVAVAHRLKGSARSVGAMRLGDLCADLEVAGTQADRAALASSLASLLLEAAAVREWIASHHAVSPA